MGGSIIAFIFPLIGLAQSVAIVPFKMSTAIHSIHFLNALCDNHLLGVSPIAYPENRLQFESLQKQATIYHPGILD